MKRFLLKLLLFVLSLSAVVLLAFCLPLTPRERTSSLWVKGYKDSLLRTCPAPRIIFVGGSNLTFGLNSQMIKDDLQLNPINTAITAGLGLAYMMDNTAKYIQEGDIVVLAPEYSHFFGRELYGSEPLLQTYLYFDSLRWADLHFEQKKALAKAFLPYVFSKFQPVQYFGIKQKGIYTKTAYNKYGDIELHWTMEQEAYTQTDTIIGAYNPDAVLLIEQFKEQVLSRGARLFITYPSYQYSAYVQDSTDIAFVERELQKLNIPILGTPERYAFADSLMFNSCYHLLKEGLDQRTERLIGDLRPHLSDDSFIYFSF